ncbi:hypothetical protein GQ53DRAFT_870684 [Thozetella sp. PMI_491]|nr:hypothetical protein GQ53DRAFT_870684 [Thozetella sp. PMI_491]
MQIRRWKQARVKAPSSAESVSTSAVEARRSLPGKRVALRFINASHPRDAHSAEAVKRIRSHAAKDVQASRRAALSRDRASSSHETATLLRSSSSATHSASGSLETRAGAIAAAMAVGPASWLSSARKDPFQSFARPVTETEHFLIDHYVTFVVPNSSSFCDHGNEEHVYLAGMKSHWLPLSFSDPGLLCGIFLTACRSLMQCAPTEAAGGDYAQMALRYRVNCIRSTNAAVTAEGASISNATIAKVLVMCADEYLRGNLDVCGVHADAIVRMVLLKGGLMDPGIGEFLKRMVSCQKSGSGALPAR